MDESPEVAGAPAPTRSVAGTPTPPDAAATERRAGAPVVGRAVEITAIGQEIAAARTGRLAALTLEGEPGIGKSRLLQAAQELAREAGFVAVSAAADEQLRGPFLLARWLLGGASVGDATDAARTTLVRAVDAVSGRDDPAVGAMAPDEKLLRVFDLATVALHALASQRPLALLVDDLQWADEDSVRLLRYVARTLSDVPVLLVVAVRPEELADTEASALLADMQRLGVVRRLHLGRLSQTESGQLLRATLGRPVDPTSVATVHAQAEGVPFILEELAAAYRGAGLVQQIDGEWTLSRTASRLVPSGVRTLIQRRAARLPADTRAVLAEAAVVGRAFSLDDLAAMCARAGASQAVTAVTDLDQLLAPAVRAGLLAELPETDPADYRFVHGQVREYAADTLAPARRRELHRALVELLTAGTDPAPESLSLIAAHALEAGDAERAARYTIDAARAALAARAPEEALRLVERALSVAGTPADRVALLTARDEALQMLRRPVERLEGLAELGALAEALDDAHLELDTLLRRAAALRVAEEPERAAQLAEEVRRRAVEGADRRAELAACLELGQARLGRPLGESYAPSPNDADLDAAQEAFAKACELARELDDLPRLAAATRELGVILNARIRAWYVALTRAGGMAPLAARVADGEDLDEIIAGLEVAGLIREASALLEQAIGYFEQLGDRRGLMSSVIAMAYMRFGPDIHLQGSARRIEEIRHLSGQLLAMTRESEREHAEAQMRYGVHVFAAAKGVVDLALDRGTEAYEQAYVLGDHTLELLAAGGTAMVELELGDVAAARRWLERATRAAAAAPTPFKARQLALWNGRACAADGDAERMVSELSRAVELATEQGRSAARCEALAQLALEAARLGAGRDEAALLDAAEAAAAEVAAIAPTLPGHPLWVARGAAARVRVALARDLSGVAAEAAREALRALVAANVEDLHADIRIAAAHGLLAGGSRRERADVRADIRMGLLLVAQRIVDEDVRTRWFHGPLARELTELVGPLPAGVGHGGTATGDDGPDAVLDADDSALLRLLIEGRNNREMAEELGLDQQELARRLARLYARTGTGSRAEATSFAFRERVI